MNEDERVESEIRRYTARLRRSLGSLQVREVDDIVLEIEGHIAERLTGVEDRPAVAAEVFEALGDPEELAARYLTESVLAQGRASQSPLELLKALQRWAMEGIFGLVVFLVGILGYGLATALVVVAVLKPFYPHHVGLWSRPPDLLAFGFVSGPPAAQYEVLGWWIIPIGLVVGCLLWLGMTRFLGSLLRRYRAFASPLQAPDRRRPR